MALLVLQFILGMLANLYATIPAQRPYEVFHELGFINLHAINGVLLLVLGSILVVKTRHESVFKRAVGGLGGLVVAFACGEVFVFTQQDMFSLLMALAFLGALFSYLRLAFEKRVHQK